MALYSFCRLDDHPILRVYNAVRTFHCGRFTERDDENGTAIRFEIRAIPKTVYYRFAMGDYRDCTQKYGIIRNRLQMPFRAI